MKSVLLFITFLIVGFLIIFFTISKKTATDIIKPKVTQRVTTSQFSLEKAPSSSLHGDITSLSGEVTWQSRIATQPATITEKRSIQQGESIETGTNGLASVAFPDMLFTLSQNSLLNVIQTLPTNVVLEQKSGIITYKSSSTATPLAVKVYPLLIQLTNSTSTISIDDDLEIISIKVSEGAVVIAYNDTDNLSTVTTIQKGQTLTFDTASRTTSIKYDKK